LAAKQEEKLKLLDKKKRKEQLRKERMIKRMEEERKKALEYDEKAEIAKKKIEIKSKILEKLTMVIEKEEKEALMPKKDNEFESEDSFPSPRFLDDDMPMPEYNAQEEEKEYHDAGDGTPRSEKSEPAGLTPIKEE
jgi:hypothetical protein